MPKNQAVDALAKSAANSTAGVVSAVEIPLPQFLQHRIQGVAFANIFRVGGAVWGRKPDFSLPSGNWKADPRRLGSRSSRAFSACPKRPRQ
jgi:hypothetical protein